MCLYATGNVSISSGWAIGTGCPRPFGPHTCLTVDCQLLNGRPAGRARHGSAAADIRLECLWPATSPQAGACRLLQRALHLGCKFGWWLQQRDKSFRRITEHQLECEWRYCSLLLESTTLCEQNYTFSFSRNNGFDQAFAVIIASEISTWPERTSSNQEKRRAPSSPFPSRQQEPSLVPHSTFP